MICMSEGATTRGFGPFFIGEIMAQRIQHAAIRDASSVHECKQILASATTDAGKVITPSATEAGRGELRSLKASELDWQGFATPGTGWMLYADSDATPTNPTAFLTGATEPFPVGENFTTVGRLPEGITALYDGVNQKVIAHSAMDVYLIQVNMHIQATAAGNLQVGFVNSTSAGAMVTTIPFLAMSSGQRRSACMVVPVYSDTVANGISITLTPDADISIAYPEIMVTLLSRG